VRPILEPWAIKNGVFTANHEDGFVVAMNIKFGEEKDQVTDAIAERLTQIAEMLSPLRSDPKAMPDNE
jgi:hypothetical protein